MLRVILINVITPILAMPKMANWVILVIRTLVNSRGARLNC
jgi:uncharacterized membrane protein